MNKTASALLSSDFTSLEQSTDGIFRLGDEVIKVLQSKDRKTEFIMFLDGRTLCAIKTLHHGTTYYELKDVSLGDKIKHVLMDLDGTTINSEPFWIDIIRLVVAECLNNENFTFSNSDLPCISGHSVTEHLTYCIKKYNLDIDLLAAMKIYRRISKQRIELLENNNDIENLIAGNRGLKELLNLIKSKALKIGLVTSGSLDKAMPEINYIFRVLGLGKPTDYYDSIITAGIPLDNNTVGTLGELESKPHPWLYLETLRIGLGYDDPDVTSVIGIEDSGAGVCALRLAGIPVIGLKSGNIISGGYDILCDRMVDSLEEVMCIIENKTNN